MMVCNAFISGLPEINLFCFFSYLVYPPFSLTLHIDGHKNQQFDTAYQDYVNLFLSCLIFHKKKFLACGICWFLHNQGKHGQIWEIREHFLLFECAHFVILRPITSKYYGSKTR